MKINVWMICGTMLCTGLFAQQATNTPPPAPADAPAAAPATVTPAEVQPAPTIAEPKSEAPARKKAAKKSAVKAPVAKKPKYELKTTPLVPGPAEVVASNVNVRGQAKLASEVVGRLTKGQTVTVLEEITLRKSGPEEPSAWAKIVIPSTVNLWVNTAYLDPATKAVKPRRLNLRTGPGENFSIAGRLDRGEIVKEVRTQGEWTAIEAPTNAYAFVAAQYLKQEPAGAAPVAEVAAVTPPATNAPPEPAPVAATVAEPPVVAAAPTDMPATNAAAAAAPAATNVAAAAPDTTAGTNAPVTIEPADQEPPPPRIVQREGVVRGTVSIQAPTKFELYSPDNGRTIDYLFSSSRELDLRRYKGMRIIVTGEEALDERWHNTPVITIQKIQVVE